MENPTDFDRAGRIILENLKKTRLEKGLTVEETAIKSAVAPEQIEQLESGDLAFLPPPYVIALLRKYALALNAYDESLFVDMKRAAEIPILRTPKTSADRVQKPQHLAGISRRKQYAAAAALIVIAMAILWMILGRAYQAPTMEAALPDASELPAAYTSPPAVPLQPTSTTIEQPAKSVPTATAEPEETTASAVNGEPETASSKTEQELSATTVQIGCFTSSIDRGNMKPGDLLKNLAPDLSAVYYYSDITMPSGEPIWHEWLLNGTTVDRISVGTPKGKRWRCWSRKSTGNRKEGQWTVRVVQGEGVEIHSDSITVAMPPAQGK
jgi:transcriptional regulator with XRE-family HTH domain